MAPMFYELLRSAANHANPSHKALRQALRRCREVRALGQRVAHVAIAQAVPGGNLLPVNQWCAHFSTSLAALSVRSISTALQM